MDKLENDEKSREERRKLGAIVAEALPGPLVFSILVGLDLAKSHEPEWGNESVVPQEMVKRARMAVWPTFHHALAAENLSLARRLTMNVPVFGQVLCSSLRPYVDAAAASMTLQRLEIHEATPWTFMQMILAGRKPPTFMHDVIGQVYDLLSEERAEALHKAFIPALAGEQADDNSLAVWLMACSEGLWKPLRPEPDGGY